jgi:putative FmdB family regulatory protein
MPFYEYKCERCNTTTSRWNTIANRATKACDVCGDPMLKLVTAVRPLWTGDVGGVGKHFPYFDRTLNCEVTSNQHRQRLCRERGLTPTDGDYDFAEEARETERRGALVDAEMRADWDYKMNGPHRAEYRRALDVIAAEKLKLWRE